MDDETTAHKTFDLENNIQSLDADKIYKYNEEEHQRIVQERPWKNNPHYFRKVRISAVALIKMAMHARSGGIYEIMGLMQGKVDGDTFVVMDAFALPVQGTETRVNAADEANEYVVQYLEMAKSVGRRENIVGWYHSHPGYGCWLSGIDVATQMTNQLTDPFLAVVIDPNRTISAGKVDIGAFRTYPEDYTPTDSQTSEYQSVPLEKIEDFGVHAARYYSLQVSHFKSSMDTHLLDLLWNKYWAMTLSQSPLISNRAYISSRLTDLADKLSRADSSVKQRTSITTLAPVSLYTSENMSATPKGKQKRASLASTGKKDESALHKVVDESDAISCECAHGLIAQVLKNAIFSTRDGSIDVEFPALN